VNGRGRVLGKAILTAMYSYNAATNERLLALADDLTDDQLDAPTDVGQGSLRKTFSHLLLMEWINRTLCQTRAYPTVSPPIVHPSTIPTLRAFAAEEARRMRDFLAGTDEEGLAIPQAVDLGGMAYQIPIWQGLVQLLTHSMQHRSEVAAMLTRYGRSPGDIDFVFFAYPELRPR